MTPLLAFLLACTTPPTITSVDPAETLVGEDIKVLGADFPAEATLSLQREGQDFALENVQVKGAILIEATVPAGIEAGTYTVTVAAGETTASLPDALSVVVPVVEVPCGGQFTANTQLSLARKLVVIDRFYKGGGRDGERETLRIDFADVEQVEYELVAVDADKLCSVIYIRTKDGQRAVFDDDTRLELKERAFKIGSTMGKKVAVTREDAETMGKPSEKN